MMEENGEAAAERPGAGALVVRTLGALLLIVGLIVAAGWALRRIGGGRFGAKIEGAPQLSVLTSVALGDRRSLAVVRFQGRTLLVGSTQQGITLLAEDDTDAGDDNNAAGDDQPPTPRSVAEMLRAGETGDFAQELSAASSRLQDGNFSRRGGETGGEA